VISGLLREIWPGLEGGAFFRVLHAIVLATGYGGLVLTIWGAIGLLIRRLTDRALKPFTTPADIFNLVFFIVAFGISLAYVLAFNRDFSMVASFVGNLLIAKFSIVPVTGNPGLVYAVSVILLSLLLAYIPLTHMSHFVGKYFAYHAVRWGDEPNVHGSEHEKKVPGLLNKHVSWSAPHIAGDGKGKTWAEAATENPAREEEN
jgi:nitrate reductase gamma subunit